MVEDLQIVGKKLALFLACALFLSLVTGFIYIDINLTDDDMLEWSWTEVSQEAMLGGIALGYFWFAWRAPALRSSLVLAGGFFTCMLIRELDFLFDYLNSDAWLQSALLVTALCLIYALIHLRRTLAGLAWQLTHPSSYLLAGGLLIILVYSRLFGMGEMWTHLHLESCNRAIKNMVEEGTELLGYSLCLLAVIALFRDIRRHGLTRPDANKVTTLPPHVNR